MQSAYVGGMLKHVPSKEELKKRTRNIALALGAGALLSISACVATNLVYHQSPSLSLGIEQPVNAAIPPPQITPQTQIPKVINNQDLEQRLIYTPKSTETNNEAGLSLHLSNDLTKKLYLQIKGRFTLPDVQYAATNIANYSAMIREECDKQGADYENISSIIFQESKGDPNAVSPLGAVGLMQLMPETAESHGCPSDKRTDPRLNIRAGIAYYQELLELFNGDKELARASYNAGEGKIQGLMNRYNTNDWNVLKLKKGLTPQTRHYSDNIDRAQEVLKATKEYGIMPVIKSLESFELAYNKKA